MALNEPSWKWDLRHTFNGFVLSREGQPINFCDVAGRLSENGGDVRSLSNYFKYWLLTHPTIGHDGALGV